VEVAVGSDLGIWQKQQSDAYLTEALAPNVTLLGVADGFGVIGRGTPTAHIALATVRDYLRRRQRRGAFGARTATPGNLRALLLAALDHTNARLYAQSGSHEDFVGSGTSLTAVLVVGHHAFVAHVGDARAYLMRLGRLETLTTDDEIFSDATFSNSKTSVPAKPLIRGLLWRSLGTQPKLEVSIFHYELLAGDQLVLCTDGIHRCIDTEEIGDAIEGADCAADAVGQLLGIAKARGTIDNATLIVSRELLVGANPAAATAGRLDRLRATIALVMLATFAISFAIYVYRFGFVTH
jgi:serine/threonine protein phosphatase PrpC